jgi:hypothetical protein
MFLAFADNEIVMWDRIYILLLLVLVVLVLVVVVVVVVVPNLGESWMLDF